MSDVMVDERGDTWVDVLRANAERIPSQRAFTFLHNGEEEQESVTFGELDRRARAVAALLARVAKPGERALLLYPQGIDYIVGFFGCLYAGVIAVPLYSPQNRRKTAMIGKVAGDCGASWALSTKAVIDKYESSWARGAKMPPMTWLSTDDLEEGEADEWTAPDISGETVAYLQYTSGSTSDPKGVALSHRPVLAQAREIVEAWGTTEHSVMVSWLPHYHDFGQVFGILQPVFQGFHCVLMSPAAFVQKPLRWLAAISHYRATHSAAPNFAFDHCVDNIAEERLKELDLGSWVTAANGAEPVRMNSLTRFYQRFKACGFRMESFSPAYGLAEATLRVTAIDWRDEPRALEFDAEGLANHQVKPPSSPTATGRVLASCGVPVMDTSVAIVNPTSLYRGRRDLHRDIWGPRPRGVSGRGGREADNEGVFRARIDGDGESGTWLRTGDLGFLHYGELFIASRIKDLIVIRGSNHYPQDIEATVEESHPLLRPGFSAAFSIEGEEGERLVVVAERKRYFDESVDYSAVMERVREEIADLHGIDVAEILIIKTGTIPKTSSGKIQRAACKALHQDGELRSLSCWRAPAPTTPEATTPAERVLEGSMHDVIRVSVGERVLGSVARVKRIDSTEVELARSLAHYGVSSLDMLELHTDIGDWLGYEIPDEWIWESKSIAELVDNIANSYGQPSVN